MAVAEIEDQLILQHILSFLSPEEAVQASLLSKAWLEAWRTRPILEFDDESILCTDSEANLAESESYLAEQKRVRTLSRYIKRTLQRYSDQNIRIDTLKITLFFDVISKSVIRKSIRTAVENNVRTLDLQLSLDDYVLGQKENIFLGDSIVNLILSNCKLRTLSVDQIRCHNIKSLKMCWVSIDELMFENIICGCPSLESLVIAKVRRYDGEEYEVDHPRVFRIRKHDNLMRIHFELFEFQSLLLGDLPRLESLGCNNEENMWAEDLLPCGFSLHSSRYQNMIRLVLGGVGILDNFFDNFGSMLPNVEDLSIECCENLGIIKLSSQSIKKIKLDNNRRLREAYFDVPKIVHFECWGEPENMPMLSFLSFSSRWVSFLRMTGPEVTPRRMTGPHEVASLWFVKLKELLSSLVQSKVSLTVILSQIPAFNIDEIKEMFVSSELVMVEKLSFVFLYTKESVSSTMPFLEGLFGIFRPRIICHHLGNKDSIHCLNLLYEILVLQRKRDQLKFWHADLKDVQVWTCKRCYFRELPELGDRVLDWQGFLDEARTIVGVEGICFKFKWITSFTRGVAKQKMGCKRKKLVRMTSDTQRPAKRRRRSRASLTSTCCD